MKVLHVEFIRDVLGRRKVSGPNENETDDRDSRGFEWGGTPGHGALLRITLLAPFFSRSAALAPKTTAQG
jgi:hypothetical protein